MGRTKQDRLTLFNYFGGKARFCKEIAELLDYDNTDIYIEPFGGAASVLLNKPTHGTEIYSDVSRGLVVLMSYLSDPDKAPELIDSLYDTVYSVDCFNECLEYRNSVDDSFLAPLEKAEMKRFRPFYKKFIKRVKKAGQLNTLKNLVADKNRSDEDKWEFVRNLLNDPTIFTTKDIEAFRAHNKDDEVSLALIQATSLDINENIGVIEEPDQSKEESDQSKEESDQLKLAVSTYVVYSMSRDGMGTAFSASKFRSSEAYYKQVDKLYRVAERLNGVQVVGAVGALSYLLESSYLNEERAMFYIDAPYLSADEDEKNLGICYKGQMELSDHRLLLETITQSKAKFLISNYDTPVYNEYLKDWTKVTIDTVTGVGGKKNNKRTECLWLNY